MASIRRLLKHRVTIQRPGSTPGDDGGDWNTDPQEYQDIATDVPALIQERTGREVPLTHEQGTVVISAMVFLDQHTDITERDRIVHPERARTYEVLYVKDAAGWGHHHQVDAELVRP